ncbi:hypothetical protein D3C76_1679110 [compost metagenome]
MPDGAVGKGGDSQDNRRAQKFAAHGQTYRHIALAQLLHVVKRGHQIENQHPQKLQNNNDCYADDNIDRYH